MYRLLCEYVLISLGHMTRNGIAESMVTLCLTFLGTAKMFSNMVG